MLLCEVREKVKCLGEGGGGRGEGGEGEGGGWVDKKRIVICVEEERIHWEGRGRRGMGDEHKKGRGVSM